MLVDTNEGKFHVGERWSFHSRDGEENATLTVVKVESSPKIGIIVHVSLEGLRMRSRHAPTGIAETVSHMPFAEAAIEKSVTRLLAKDAPLPSFEEGYQQWRAAFDQNKAGFFTATVAEGIDFIDNAIQG